MSPARVRLAASTLAVLLTVLLLPALPASAARAADGRPDGNGPAAWDAAAPRQVLCGTTVCVHWVTTTADAPPLASTDGVTPDWVRRNLVVAEQSLTRMAALGYPAPPSDGGAGGTTQFDVYLVDISPAGLYGYCVPEDRLPGQPRRASSYCVFDDDFTGFPMAPDPSLRVTAAHELFHAVQFGFDTQEDAWFMESTATWMEEQVADDVNDNRQYLRESQLGRPARALDHADGGLGVYGNWLFFQFLAQRFGADAVRQIWLRAAGTRRDAYSIEAIRGYLAARGLRFADVYARFALANLEPGRSYAEGGSYRGAAYDDTVRLGRHRRAWTQARIPVRHLTSHRVAVRPAPGLPARARLRVRVRAERGDRRAGAAVLVAVRLRSGTVRRLPVRLHDGVGTRVVAFGRARRVSVVLANGSTRYDCGRRTPFACHGRPLDERQRFRLELDVAGIRG